MERYFLKDHKTCLRRQGFTLLELLIVIAIIGILISIGVVSYGAAQKKSRDSRRMSDLKAVQAAFEQYYADNYGTYPKDCKLSATYLPAGFPKDPKTNEDYPPPTCDLLEGKTYCFCATLESGAGNASNLACSYENSGPDYCVGNLQ